MRFASLVIVALILSLGIGNVASAQARVQLPTFHYVTGATTVLVPDQGQALIGGVGRAQAGRNQFGVPGLAKIPGLGRPFNNSGIGQSFGAGNLSVRAQIHDLDAMDQALLRQAASGRGAAGDLVRLPGTPASGTIPLSIAEAQHRRETAAATERREIEDLLARARTAEQEGRSKVARLYYRVIARDAQNGELRALAQARLDAISGRTSSLAASEKGATGR